VTARFASQSNRAAFLATVVKQLAALLRLPQQRLDEATADRLFGHLLVQAEVRCRELDERLVLLVDGLDEDRGATADGHSIAAVLPDAPVGQLRVVVAGHPNPPIPRDVPDNHPLRREAIVRPLATSESAAAKRRHMERELDVLLESSGLEHDLLGRMTCGVAIKRPFDIRIPLDGHWYVAVETEGLSASRFFAEITIVA
jgi:hypothetical protein